jgi:myosin heavy subunit
MDGRLCTAPSGWAICELARLVLFWRGLERTQFGGRAGAWTALHVTVAVDKMERLKIIVGVRMVAKKCTVCRHNLPVKRRSDRRYCGVRCRVRAHRLRGAAQQASDASDDLTAAEIAAATAGAAAAALLVETLRKQLKETEETRDQRTRELSQVRGELQKTEDARLASAQEAAIQRAKVSNLSRYYYEAENEIGRLSQEQQAMSHALTTLRAEQADRALRIQQLDAAKQSAERKVVRLESAKEQPRRALPSATKQRQQNQTQELRERIRERDKQLRELNRKLLAIEKTHQKRLTAHEPTEQELRAEVERLTRKLSAAQAEVERLSLRLDKKKKSNKKLKRTLEEEQSRGLLSRLFSGGSNRHGGSGSGGKSDKARRSHRISRGKPEPRTLPAQPVRALPAPRKCLPPKSET